jgi:hypothetical protein
LNAKSDAISKIFNYDDWGVFVDFFKFVDGLFGPHSFDRFTNSENFKINKFNSKFHTPGTSGVDAFAFNWAGENNWLVPPLNLVNRVIKHCLACGAFGTLVVPKWESSPFWPVIFHSNSSCMHYISDVLEFKDPKDIYIYGSNKKSLFGSERFKSSVLVVRISPL